MISEWGGVMYDYDDDEGCVPQTFFFLWTVEKDSNDVSIMNKKRAWKKADIYANNFRGETGERDKQDPYKLHH